MATGTIPYIDPNVEHVGVSRLRKLNSEGLRNIKKALVLQDNDIPLAVLLKYEQFLIMQNQLRKLLEDVAASRKKTITEVRAALKKKGK